MGWAPTHFAKPRINTGYTYELRSLVHVDYVLGTEVYGSKLLCCRRDLCVFGFCSGAVVESAKLAVGI